MVGGQYDGQYATSANGDDVGISQTPSQFVLDGNNIEDASNSDNVWTTADGATSLVYDGDNSDAGLTPVTCTISTANNILTCVRSNADGDARSDNVLQTCPNYGVALLISDSLYQSDCTALSLLAICGDVNPTTTTTTMTTTTTTTTTTSSTTNTSPSPTCGLQVIAGPYYNDFAVLNDQNHMIGFNYQTPTQFVLDGDNIVVSSDPETKWLAYGGSASYIYAGHTEDLDPNLTPLVCTISAANVLTCAESNPNYDVSSYNVLQACNDDRDYLVIANEVGRNCQAITFLETCDDTATTTATTTTTTTTTTTVS